jgi:UPF0271 protein
MASRVMRRIDLNADIGEGFGAWRMGDDAALLALVSSANIACGFHAGDPRTMRESVALCLRHGVAIGAHPSYPDREGFGRRDMALTPAEIHDAVLYQASALAGIAAAAGARLAHLKPHGALYNRAAVDREAADAIARAVHALDPSLRLVGLAGSCLLDAGRALGLRVLAEGFADRRYDAQGRLVSRREPDALIEDPAESVAQVLRMIRDGLVEARDGRRVALAVDTVCLHGDSPRAVVFARQLRAALDAAGIAVGASAA